MLDFNIFLHFLLFKRLNHRKNYVLFICIACAIQIASAKGETIPTSLEFGGDGFDIPAGEVKNRLGVSAKLRIKGLGLNLGATENVQGSLNYKELKLCKSRKEVKVEDVKPKERKWIALFHLPYDHLRNQTFANGTNCQSVLEKVKSALLLGASAVIILSLNPKLFKDLDLSQLLWKPVVLIQQSEDVSSVLKLIKQKSDVRVKITYDSSVYDIQKVTLWSMCGRPQPGSGVVCIGDSGFEKTNPSSFWNYFFSLLATLILLLLVKARNGPNYEGYDGMEQSIRKIAYQALSAMETRRYHGSGNACNHESVHRETCAVCLEDFRDKQKVRVLPCVHLYHTKCVDPWLIKQRTCPLCKYNILEKFSSEVKA